MISVHYLSTHWGRRYAFAPPQTPRGSVDGGDPVASLTPGIHTQLTRGPRRFLMSAADAGAGRIIRKAEGL
jgi:hypothetical protein